MVNGRWILSLWVSSCPYALPLILAVPPPTTGYQVSRALAHIYRQQYRQSYRHLSSRAHAMGSTGCLGPVSGNSLQFRWEWGEIPCTLPSLPIESRTVAVPHCLGWRSHDPESGGFVCLRLLAFTCHRFSGGFRCSSITHAQTGVESSECIRIHGG